MSVLRPGSIVGGTYRVVQLVGAGAMGEVYEATHARLAGRYAIKVLQPSIAANAEALERFRREAEITSSLRHPNIVHIMDFDRLPQGAPYLVMEFLEGLDLGGRLHQLGPPPIDEVVVLVGQIASALEAAHRRGVVHRDLKPQNVCLVPLTGQSRSVVKVVDFGMSKIRSAAGPLTRERALIGTAAYMSPEQALGSMDDVDHRTDQFALGVMAYEMLTGRDAFPGGNEPAILFKIVHQEPAPLVLAHPAHPSRQDALAAVVGRALHKDKNKRYPSILDFALAFEDASGIVRAASRTRAIFDSREGVPTVGGRAAATAATIPDGPPAQMTTGSGTTGERLAVRRPAPRWPAVAVAVALGAFALGTTAGGLWRPRARPAVALVPAAPPPPVVAAPAPPPPPPVTIDVDGAPEGTRVEWDHHPATLPLSVAPDPQPHHLKVDAPGLVPYETDLVADRSRTIVLARPLERPRPLRRRGPGHGRPSTQVTGDLAP